eukprot:TRINITY_DN43226_c0_g1_i1.p1 TRINITY_DN43226_c0_g1~~TRINITY_DN43226_c0_g1_i1.p1  ORF type:complete len:286 (+),score=72.89 TRINITY_DN43226_c0_g1_i1:51-860(+)
MAMGLKNLIPVILLVGMLCCVPYMDTISPSQIEGWEGYDRDAGIIVYLYFAGGMAGVGSVLHFLYAKFVSNKGLDANNFVSLVLSVFFASNWVYVITVGVPTPLSIGAQSGACAGYEFYGLIIELASMITGKTRLDMIVHHGTCLLFTVFTLAVYCTVPVGDLFYWHVIWDSISRMLISNVPLHIRLIKTNALTNLLFYVVFLWGRWIEQVTFVKLMWKSSLQWESNITTGVIISWLALHVLNIFWGIKLCIIAWGLKGGRPKPEKKVE